MQGIASSAYIVFQLGPFQNSFAALDVFTVNRKIRRNLAQLLLGGLGTPLFYGGLFLVVVYLVRDLLRRLFLYLLLASFASHFLGMLL